MLDKIKIKNIRQIMLCLMGRSSATKACIGEDTGLSTSTVSSCVNSLLKLNLLLADGMEESYGGRRSTIYRLNKEYGSFIGLELQAGMIRGVVTDFEINTVKNILRPVEGEIFPIGEIMAVLDRETAEKGKILGIGICVSGQMSYRNQIILSAPELKWQFVHLKEILERRYMIFTHLEHPVNGAAIYEGTVGCARGGNNFLYIGEGMEGKAALVLDGSLCRGKDNMAGNLSGRQIRAEMLAFLGLDRLIVGYRTEDFRNRTCQAAEGFGGEILCTRQPEEIYALGAAAAAQCQWFESIYFML